MRSEITLNIIDILTSRKSIKDAQMQNIKISSIDEIRDKIIQFYAMYRLNIKADELSKKVLGRSRSSEYVIIRHMVSYFAKRLTNKSLKSIGMALGGRDHSTVIHGIQRIEDALMVRRGKYRDLIVANDVRDIIIFLMINGNK